MSPIKRRHFLQFAGSSLAAIGLSQLDLIRQANSYNQVLAQGTRRKLALLVGVNNYPAGISSLRGCLNDVEMQYELLVNRYGFNCHDIVRITDDTELKPTRENILTVFEEHLIKQAKPGDIVVFHYSGHGSLVLDPDPIPEFGANNGTLIPYDARTGDAVNDIMGKTIFFAHVCVKNRECNYHPR